MSGPARANEATCRSGDTRRELAEPAAELAPQVPEKRSSTRAAAASARGRAWKCWLGRWRRIGDKTYHFIELMHWANAEGGIGSSTILGREGPAVGREDAILLSGVTADVDYLYAQATAARSPRPAVEANAAVTLARAAPTMRT